MLTENKSDDIKVEVRHVGNTLPRLDTETSLHRKLTKEAVTYFEGPHDIQRHSKLPLFMRLNGGILPRMILPLLFAGSWSTAVMLIHKFVHDVGTYLLLWGLIVEMIH